MRKRSELSLILGVLIWIGILSGGYLLVSQLFDDSNATASQLSTYLTHRRKIVELEFDRRRLVKVGDPIFTQDGETVVPVGYVYRLHTIDSEETGIDFSDRVFAKLYGCAPPLDSNSRMTYHATPDSMGWVIETMLPPEKRLEITRLIVKSFQEEQDGIVAALKPIVENSVREAAEVIREEFKVAFDKREDRLEEIGERFKVEILQEQIVPLVQEEVFPIVQEEATPLANEIGSEMWKEVSLWSFAWRSVVDKMPWRERKLMKEQFEKFTKEKVIPILEKRMPEILDVQGRIIKRVAQNKKVQAVMTDSAKSVMQDPEVQAVLTEVFQDVFVNNTRLKQVMEKNWSSEEAEAALALTSRRLEPTVTKIGETLFGNPRKEITPEFSRVLRKRILNKDDRWIRLEVKKDGPAANGNALTRGESGYPLIKVLEGEPGTPNPFHVPAGDAR